MEFERSYFPNKQEEEAMEQDMLRGVLVSEDDPSGSGGKGGQNVNKRATKVRLRVVFEDEELRNRMLALFPGFFTKKGEMLVEASEERTQEQNRDIAWKRLEARVRQGRETPKERKATKPKPSARETRLSEKRRTAEKKELRKRIEW